MSFGRYFEIVFGARSSTLECLKQLTCFQWTSQVFSVGEGYCWNMSRKSIWNHLQNHLTPCWTFGKTSISAISCQIKNHSNPRGDEGKVFVKSVKLTPLLFAYLPTNCCIIFIIYISKSKFECLLLPSLLPIFHPNHPTRAIAI